MSAYGVGSHTMAAEAAVEIVSQKLEILLSRPEWVDCLGMETLVKDAKAKLATIQDFFSARDRPYRSREWSGKLLIAMYETEDILDKFHLRVASRRQEALHVATRPLAVRVHKYMLWRDLSKQVKVMEEWCQDYYLTDKEVGDEGKKEPARSSAPWGGQKLTRLTGLWDRQASMNFLCDEAEKIAKEEIMKRIRQGGDVLRISILGEQGSGKTFLARWVYREAMNLGFDLRAWVRVSANADKREFLFEILKQVDKPSRNLTDFDEIKKTLRQKLARTERFLIRLLQELMMIILPSRGLIITTTQSDEIARIMNTAKPNPIKLEKLCREASQKMLATKLHGVPHISSLTREEDKILNRFPAVPLCISLLGGLLSNAGENERATLAKSDFKMELSYLLQLSHHRLPVYLKPCFIYMVLFPVASPIPTRRLVRLWMAEGLLDSHCYDREGKTTRLPEDVGETFILELANRNVIDVVSWRADGSPKACQMLDSLYDMIHPTMMSSKFLYIRDASKLEDRNYHDPIGQRLWRQDEQIEKAGVRGLRTTQTYYSDLNLGHVRSFLSFYRRRGVLTKDVSTFLRKMTSETDYSWLRVLDLEGVNKPSLQGVLHKLVLLRYLGLRSTSLDSIPRQVADLHHLETLDIKHTDITSLPSSMWKAKKLRHLHLNWFYIDFKKILKACSNNDEALTQLQTLSGLVVGEVKKNLMRNHMDSLTTLITLKLYWQRSDTDTSAAAEKAVADWISFRLTNLQSLTFGLIQEAKPTKETKPAASQIGLLPKLSLAEQHHKLLKLYLLGQLNKPIWSQLLPASLMVLTLSSSKLEIDMMSELGGLLRNLRTLRLLGNSFLGTSLTFVKEGFPNLKILKIWKLPKLEKVIIEHGAMLHLKELEHRHLDRLKTVEGIKECTELETVRVVFKKAAPGYVDHLNEEKGEKTKLYKIEETKTLEPEDDDVCDEDEDASP
ncbi:hypothetical protein BT93_G1509 [Corymbia citriodora subsp. variegata]|nr:hypothetical protein BT93_G1509 [Corymbia citriodora subsp. variegata]